MAPVRVCLLLAAGLALAACETEFEPFEQSDLTFSLFGVLDAAADTQFVRVADLRRPARVGEPLDATVTLEHLGTGARTVLRDSVFVLAGGGVVHNVWTPERVAADAPYRITASRPGGTAATAELRTPPTFPDPELDSGITLSTSVANPPRLQQVFFPGVEAFADLRIRYRLTSGTVVVSYLDRAVPMDGGGFRIAFNAYEDAQRALTGRPGEGCPSLRSAEVVVAATTAAWPDVLELDPEAAALPGTITNVEGGVGFVGGVERRRGPWPAMAAVFGFHEAGCAP